MPQGGQKTSSSGSGFQKGGILRKNPLLFFRANLSADCRTLATGRKVDFIPDGGHGSYSAAFHRKP